MALADQFQFSSLLKLYVTPPEKEIQDAQGEPDPLAKSAKASPRDKEAAPAPRAKPAERPDRPNEAAPRPRATDNDEPEIKFDPAEAKEELSRAADGDKSDRSDRTDTPTAERPANDAKTGDPSASQQTGANDAEPAVIAASAAIPLAEIAKAALPADPVPSTPDGEETPKSATNQPVQTKIDTGKPNLGAAALQSLEITDETETIDGARQSKSDPGSGRTGAHPDANSQAARQAADLAQRLGLGPQPGQVNVTVETSNPNPAPSQNLAPAAVLADAGGGDDGAPTFTANQGKSDGGHVAPDRQADGRSAPPTNPNAPGPNGSQGDFTNASQAIRAQVLAAGAQSAATASGVTAKPTPAAVEPAPIAGTTTLGGPSQTAETAKATPTQPARTPVPTRSPAEQIAVQIQKVFGAGADRISIRLHPAQLGRVEVKLEVGKDGHLVAAISADKPETLEMLQRDARILERALLAAGLQTDSDSLSFSLRGDNSQQALPEDRGAGRPIAPAGEPAVGEIANADPVAANVAYGQNLAPDGHVDITV